MWRVYCIADRPGNHGFTMGAKHFALFFETASEGEARAKRDELAKARRTILRRETA